MVKYNPTKPLLFIHTPKTAGTFVRNLLKLWFPADNLYTCYDPCSLLKIQADVLKEQKPNSVLYGHISSIIPGWDNQVVTIVREPFARAVSEYFHRKRKKTLWQVSIRYKSNTGFKIRHPENLIDYLTNAAPAIWPRRYFRERINLTNYKKYIDSRFLFIGVTEHLNESLIKLANILSKYYHPTLLRQVNVGSYDEEIPTSLRETFKEKLKLDYAVYEYVLSKF